MRHACHPRRWLNAPSPTVSRAACRSGPFRGCAAVEVQQVLDRLRLTRSVFIPEIANSPAGAAN